MFLCKEEIQKIATEILQKLSIVAPSVTIKGDVNRAAMGNQRGGAGVSIAPGVSNPMGMQTGSQPKSPLSTSGVSDGKSTSKA